MISLNRKNRLLAGAAFGAGMLVVAQPAAAQCVAATTATINDTRLCGTTPTTNTTGSGPVDRNVLYGTGVDTFLVVSSGAAVTGFGLAWSPLGVGTFTTTITNNGSVTVDAGNTPTAGGDGALRINSAGLNSVVYNGNGSITNLDVVGLGDGLYIDSSGAGNITATVGGNVTTSANSSFGIAAQTSGNGGNVALSTLAGTTVRAGLAGIIGQINNAASNGTLSVTNGGTVLSAVGAPNTLNIGVSALSSGTGNVTVANNGAIGSASDRVGSGVSASIVNNTSAATLTVSGSAASTIFTSGDGVQASHSGIGVTNVTYLGAINSTGNTGIETSAFNGATTNVTTGAGAITASGVGGVGINHQGTVGAITIAAGAGAVTGADYGIQAASTGTQGITAGGVVTGTAIAGIHSNTTANRIISVGTAGNVTGGTEAILIANTGTATVTNSGIIGAASNGLAVEATGAGATTITNNASGTINGRLTLTAAADSLVNGGIFNTQGTTIFGAGADVLNNQAAGVINILGATSFTGLETFTQNGRINLNANTLTLSGTPFTNAGTIDTSGNASILGITAFNNTGSLDLAPGTFTVPAVVFTNSGTIFADEGASAISVQTNFANSGTLDLADAAVGDVLTINSNFVGSGGSNLLIDFNDTTADRLVINGAASGSTTVNAFTTGAGLFNIGGVLAVDTVSTSANAFVLGSVNGNTSPLVDYALVQAGSDYFLTSAPNPSAFDPVAISNLASSIWYQSADEVENQTDLPSVTVGTSFWGQLYYSEDKFGDDNEVAIIQGTAFGVDNELKTKRMGVQGGIDYGFGGARIGLTGGYGQAKADNDLNNGFKAKGWNAGVYGQFGGYTGFHGSALVKYDRYKLRFDDGAFDGERARLTALGADGSLGYRFGLGETATLDAKVGLSHVKTKINDINAFGFNYDIGTVTSTRGRAGLRATFGGNLAPYVDATVFREFNGDGNVELFDGLNFYDIDSDGRGTWARLEAGLAARSGPGPILAAWADLGDKKGFGVRAGFRFGGRAEEALPPPPPMAPMAPPPPPPPPTQTCADGSVILASDMCPPPPPPPPPAPEPERG